MTEAEAKSKGCPWARLHSQSAINRTPGGVYHPNATCQGNKCMAWVWLTSEKNDGTCSLCRNEVSN
jgi:hypothetical protein